MITFILIVCSLLFSFFYILNRKPNGFNPLNLPPGPPKLPIIGNIHQFVGAVPHRAFHDLAKIYGPIMHMQLGQISTIIVSSPRLAKEVLKTNDLAISNRPHSMVADIVTYGSTDIAFSPYSDYFRQMKKILTMEVLSQQKVKSFFGLLQNEVDNLMEFIRSTSGNPFMVHRSVLKVNNNFMCKSLFGDNCKQEDMLIEVAGGVVVVANYFHVANLFPKFGLLSVITGIKSKLMKIHKTLDKILDDIFKERKIKRQRDGALEEDLLDVLLNIKERGGLQFPITDNNIKAILLDMFIGGVDTSSSTIEWAMKELMRNPNVMKKAQIEVREAFKGKKPIKDKDLQELVYLKLIIKETLRLHHPPLLLPRECRQHCQIDGYDIPMKTTVIVNSFACATDPKYWDDAESFKPERFEKSSLDFSGTNYEFLPFGAGRRMCPGTNFGLSFVEFTLAQMLYHFDWKLPYGVNPNDLDMNDAKVPLQLIPTLYSPTS